MWVWIKWCKHLFRNVTHSAEKLRNRLIELERWTALSDGFNDFSLTSDLLLSWSWNMRILSILKQPKKLEKNEIWQKSVGKAPCRRKTYLNSIKLATVSAVGCVLGAMQYWLLLASVGPSLGTWCLRRWLDEAGTFYHREDVRLVLIWYSSNSSMRPWPGNVLPWYSLVGMWTCGATGGLEAAHGVATLA